jgi:hypothetical protein
MKTFAFASRLVVCAALVGLARLASGAPPALPKRIVVTARNDTRVQYLVPASAEDGAAPEETSDGPIDPVRVDRVSGRRTRMPSRITVSYVSATGKVTEAALHGLSTAHLPTCGSSNDERIEGIMAPVVIDCPSVDDVAVAFMVHHFEHGMGHIVTAHLPGLFHYSRSVAAGDEHTTFTSFIDGSSCSYSGPSDRDRGPKNTCDFNVEFHFDTARPN